MKKLLLASVAVLFIGGAAQAEYVFHYEGRTIRIDPDRGKVSIPGVYDNTGHHAKKKGKAGEPDTQKDPAQEAGKEAGKAPAAHDDAPAKDARAPAAAAPTPTTTASNAPGTGLTRSTASPLGVWAGGEKDGKVRIEPCGAVLCGYVVDASNQNREVVLFNMKPGEDQQWTGRIVDASSGSTYESTIALDGTDKLKVQCSSSAEFCAERTWSRAN